MADCARKRGKVRFQGKVPIVPDGASVLGRAVDELVAREGTSVHLADINLGACRAWDVESENWPQRGQFLPDLQAHSPAMGQKDGEKWTAAADLQPTYPKSDRLLDIAKGNIRVNVVCPAVIRTPFTAVDVLEEKETADCMTASHPMGRFDDPQDVAKAVAFLACEDASFITDVGLPVDGGWTAR